MSTSNIGKRRAAAQEQGTPEYHVRRRQIADAAAKVFNERGFAGTSVSAVAEELGTDRASLYYYVSSKEELFDEVVREASEANLRTAEAILSEDAQAPEKLRKLIVALMRSYEEHYPLLYVFLREDLRKVAGKRSDWSQHMQSISKRYEDVVIAVVEEGFAQGTLRQVASARVVAYGILGAMNWTNRWFNPERCESSAQAVGEAYADLLLGGLIAEPA
jgi:TetR/AcrR family transcriptional regulator, cholesterol catabolism regulator